MTLEALINLLAQYPQWLAAYLLGIPLLAGTLGLLLKSRLTAIRSPWKYAYSLLVYLLCIPGTLALSLLVYHLLFTQQNLLRLNLFIYFLPPISMAIGLWFIQRKISFQAIPGFERLSALMLLLGLTFFILFLLDRTRIIVGFIGSLTHLLILGLLLFLVLRWTLRKLF